MAGVTAVGGEDRSGPPVRVMVVDDDPLVRAGLVMMLGGAGDLLVVAEAGDGSQALALIERHRPHVVLMDIRMPVMDGQAATEAIRSRPSPPEVLVLTTFDADEQVVRALRAGAAGFLLKDTAPREIVTAVRQVAAGMSVLSPSATRGLLSRTAGAERDSHRAAAAGRLARLNERERHVAQAVGRGLSNAEIGAALFLGVPTVKGYVSAILTKLGLDNRVQIALLVHDAAPAGDDLPSTGGAPAPG